MKMKKELKLKLIKVEWKDAATRHDVSVSLKEAKKEELIDAETIGYLIEENKEKVVMTSMYFIDNKDEESEIFPKTIHVIPKKTIKNIFELITRDKIRKILREPIKVDFTKPSKLFKKQKRGKK